MHITYKREKPFAKIHLRMVCMGVKSKYMHMVKGHLLRTKTKKLITTEEGI
jgi:hypothetical protein